MPTKKPVTNFLPEGVAKGRHERAKEIMEYRKSESAQKILRAMTDEKEYEVDGKKYKRRVAKSPYTGEDFPANKKYGTDPESGKRAKAMYETHKDIVIERWELAKRDFAEEEDYELYNPGKGKRKFLEAKQSLVEEEKKLLEAQEKVTALKTKLWLGEKAPQDKSWQVEQHREEWERAMNDCTMPNMGTAIHYYRQASEEDKAYLRKILKYEKNSVVILENGKEIFRSYWMLQPKWLKNFKQEPYSTEAWEQMNIEAQWIDWFEADRKSPVGSYELKKEVLKASRMKDTITAGDDSEWNKIYNLFAKRTNNAWGQEIPWQQVARQMLWISWYIWTNQKFSSGSARYCRMRPGLCNRYYFNIGYNSLSVVGLERLHTDS